MFTSGLCLGYKTEGFHNSDANSQTPHNSSFTSFLSKALFETHRQAKESHDFPPSSCKSTGRLTPRAVVRTFWVIIHQNVENSQHPAQQEAHHPQRRRTHKEQLRGATHPIHLHRIALCHRTIQGGIDTAMFGFG